MPTSDSENKDIIKDWILNPKTILDIGCGEGTYYDLLNDGTQHWVGVEVFYPYVQRYNLLSKYNEVVTADARYLNYHKLGVFDLSIAADMLEHMKAGEAKEIIENLVRISKHVLICFPVLHLHQHIEENPYENHIDHWTYKQMNDYLKESDFEIINSVEGDVLAYFFIKGKI